MTEDRLREILAAVPDARVAVLTPGVRRVVREELEDVGDPPGPHVGGVGRGEVPPHVDVFVDAVRGPPGFGVLSGGPRHGGRFLPA